MTKTHIALVLVAAVLGGAGCASNDEILGEAIGAATASSDSATTTVDAATQMGSDASTTTTADAGTTTGSDGGTSGTVDAAVDDGSGSDGSGSGSDEEDDCGDGLVFLDPYSAQYNVAGDTVSVDPHSMNGTAPFSFSASGLPPGLSISGTSGRISGTLATTAYVGSPYRVTVSITDGASNARSVSFNWRIDRGAIPHRESTVGQAVSASLPVAPGTPPYIYVVTGLPPGLSANTFTGTVTGTTPLDAALGPYTVTVSTTGGMVSDTYSFNWYLWGQTLQTAIEPADQNTWEGESVALRLPLPNGMAPYTYQVTGLPPGLMLDTATRTIRGTMPEGAQLGSPYAVTLHATSYDGIVSTYAFRWTVYSYGTVDANPTPTFETTTTKAF